MKNRVKKFLLTPVWAVCTVVALMIVVSATAQIVLSDSVCRKIISKAAPHFLDGTLEVSHASVNMFRNFPRMTATLEDVVLTYPAERFDSVKRCGAQGMLALMGNGPEADTLAYFSSLTASMNPFALLRRTIRIRELSLEKPHAYLHSYEDGSANWDLVKIAFADQADEDTPADTSSSAFILDVKKLHLGGRPLIVYTDQKKELMTLASLKEYSFEGRFDSIDPAQSEFRTSMDSLFVTGRYVSDTLLFRMNRFNADCRDGGVMFSANADAFAASRNYGRIVIPISLEGELDMSRDTLGHMNYAMREVDLDVASLCLQADMDITMGSAGKMFLDGNLTVQEGEIQKIIDGFGVRVVPQLKDVRTDACLQARLDVDGVYDPSVGRMPSLSLDTNLKGTGIDVGIKADVRDFIKDDAAVRLDAGMNLTIDRFAALLHTLSGYDVSGKLQASAKGAFKLSQLNMYQFSKVDLNAALDICSLSVSDDSLNVFVDSLQIRSGLMDNRFAKAKKSSSVPSRSLGAKVKIDSLNLSYGSLGKLEGRDISALFMGSTSGIVVSDSVHYNPLMVRLNLGRVRLEDSDSVQLSLRKSENTFVVRPVSAQDRTPLLKVTSNNGALRLVAGVHRVFLSDLGFNADARMSRERMNREKMRQNQRRHGRRPLDPEGRMLNHAVVDDFAANDISFNLGEGILKYYRDWNASGNIALKSARLVTPAFPLRSAVTDFKGSFDNDHIALDTLRVVAGGSNFSASGAVSNLGRAITRHGKIKLRLGVTTDSLAVTELFGAYAMGRQNMVARTDALASATDSDIERMLDDSKVEEASATPALIVIPANLDAEISLRGKGVSYSSLDMRDMNASLVIRDRCMLVSDVRALTSVGDLFVDCFYSTRSKQDICMGVDLDLKKVSAGEVISLMPQLEQMMPLIKSFDGLLDCNVSLVSKLDTCMNFITSSANGIVRLGGRDLHFRDNKQIEKFARLLWVKNPKRVTIDTMTVEGVLRDNVMEVFPFVMKIDKWSVVAAGLQNLDKSFKYHVSVAKSPLGIRMGANIFGDNFDNYKFKLGRAIYRNEHVPSFSVVIDSTKVNLRESILHVMERGVDRAMRETAENDLIRAARQDAGYVHSVALDSLQSLSVDENRLMESMNVDEAVASPETALSAGDKPDAESGSEQQEDKAAEPADNVAKSHKRRNK